MSMVATDFKGLLKVSIKSRHDSHTDQYNRILMVKLLLVSSAIMGISWFKDSMNCMVPEFHAISDDDKFVPGACWIQGVYVYKELKTRIDKVAYFGIPKDINNDGMLPSGSLCTTQKRFDKEPDPECRSMEKTYFLQYQWMPFLIAGLALMYYIPYLVFRQVNHDLVSLKNTVKDKKSPPNAAKITKAFFKPSLKPRRMDILRVLLNICVKILYLIVNVVALLGLDSVLNDEYVSYGGEWVKWARMNNTIAYDYMGMRDFPKPGNLLLPPFGFCEIYESAKDIKTTVGNRHKVICELSQNILYQYVLIVLWFAFIIGIVVSIIGLVVLLVHYLLGVLKIRKADAPYKMLFNSLSFRELEYLQFVQKKNLQLYGEILENLQNKVIGGSKNGKIMNNYY